MSDSLRDDILKAARDANASSMHWIHVSPSKFICSNCGRSVKSEERYCPSCGKKEYNTEDKINVL